MTCCGLFWHVGFDAGGFGLLLEGAILMCSWFPSIEEKKT